MLARRKPAKSGIRDQDGPIRSEAHLKFVRGFVCVAHESGECSGRVEAAHYRTAANSGTGVKPGDDWAFPACAHHHAEQHRIGQPEFERRHGVNLAKTAQTFAKTSIYIQRIRRERGEA